MLRDWDDSGQVYEPKTVKSAYLMNCESTFAYLFGIQSVKSLFMILIFSRMNLSGLM